MGVGCRIGIEWLQKQVRATQVPGRCVGLLLTALKAGDDIVLQ
jgi:hypothetical protein